MHKTVYFIIQYTFCNLKYIIFYILVTILVTNKLYVNGKNRHTILGAKNYRPIIT